MPDKWMPPDMDDFVNAYMAGESPNSLSHRYQISRPAILRRLTEQGITLRDSTAANRLLAAARSPEQRRRYAEAAHAAVRGKRQTREHRENLARTRQERQLGVSPAELALQCWLHERGIESIPQQAVGPYNVDLGAYPVAVEVFGGTWHQHRDRPGAFANRTRYLLDRGWHLVIVWVGTGTRIPALSTKVADYLVAFHQRASSDPTAPREYRVIWGDAKEVAPSHLQLDQLTRIPSRRAANRARS